MRITSILTHVINAFELNFLTTLSSFNPKIISFSLFLNKYFPRKICLQLVFPQYNLEHIIGNKWILICQTGWCQIFKVNDGQPLELGAGASVSQISNTIRKWRVWPRYQILLTETPPIWRKRGTGQFPTSKYKIIFHGSDSSLKPSQQGRWVKYLSWWYNTRILHTYLWQPLTVSDSGTRWQDKFQTLSEKSNQLDDLAISVTSPVTAQVQDEVWKCAIFYQERWGVLTG